MPKEDFIKQYSVYSNGEVFIESVFTALKDDKEKTMAYLVRFISNHDISDFSIASLKKLLLHVMEMASKKLELQDYAAFRSFSMHIMRMRMIISHMEKSLQTQPNPDLASPPKHKKRISSSEPAYSAKNPSYVK